MLEPTHAPRRAGSSSSTLVVLPALSGVVFFGCFGQRGPTYPEVRAAICAGGSLLPPSAARTELERACRLEATVAECAQAFEKAAKVAPAPTARQSQ